MEKSTAGTNKRSPDGVSHPNRNTIIIKNLVKFYKKWKNHNEFQLTKENGLKYSKIDKSPTLPLTQLPKKQNKLK